MAESNFIDYVKIHCKSGKGGKGSTYLERSKVDSKGGPAGGDGGSGGNIILRGNAQLWTLLHLKYQKHVKAGNGGDGGKSRSTGKQGKDIILDVPLGTIAKDPNTGAQVLEILEDGEEKVLMNGGRGGLGNWHFKSSTRQTPRFAQPGEEGIEDWRILELKVLADVGLVGFPNAGKSTLLSVVSAAKPKIANYPFTTLVPNLGMVQYRDFKSFVMADIPGIIEGAHEGKGLGHRFLRHIERNAILLFLIPADSDDILKEHKILMKELKLFSKELATKNIIVAISKSDMLDEELKAEMYEEIKELDPYFISAVSGEGIMELKDKMWRVLNGEDEVEE
jgi:GTP-binding protein